MNMDKQEFAVALARGSGRAMILLAQTAEPEKFKDELISACVRNLAYDHQCELERSAYLARLIEATGRRDEIFVALASRLKASPQDGVDISHLFAVLARIAASGSDPEKSILRQAFHDFRPDDQLESMEALIRLDGLTALLKCAELISVDLSEEGWRIASLFEALEEHAGTAAGAILLKAGSEHSEIGLLIAHRDFQLRPAESGTDAPYDFSKIRSGLLNGKRPPGAWLRKLTEQEWQLLAADFELQTDEARALIYLRLFATRRFPGPAQQLMRWVNCSNSRVAWAAAGALGRIRDPLVRKLALERLRGKDSTGLRLLLSNYEAGDLDPIGSLLSEAVDDDEAHDLGFGILNIVGENDVPLAEKRAVLISLYERSPCSICRGNAVSKLQSAGDVPLPIAQECRFDADPDTARQFSAEA
ncbi:MAG: hypothetical protein ABIO86_09240 [Sphingomonas sp.]